MRREQNDPLRKIGLTLGRERLLRQQVLAVQAEPDVALPEVESVLNALTRPSLWGKRERLDASWLIAHADWSEDQRILLSKKLSEAVVAALLTRMPLRVARRWLWRGAFVFYPFMLELVFELFHDGEDPFKCFFVGFIYSLLVTMIGGVVTLPLSVWVDNQHLKQFRPAVEALGSVGQTAAILPLVEASRDIALRAAATSALMQVISRLGQEAYGTLPLQCIPTLCRALTNETPRQTLLVVLQVLAVIGDGRAIQAVEYQMKRTATHPEVREAATKLLPILQQRARESQAASLLLRASDAPAESEQTLLRASWEQPNTDSSQLLRMAPTTGSEEQELEKQRLG